VVSQQLVEIAERAMDAFNRRDLDAFTRSMTSDIEWFPALERGLDGSGYRGHEGVATHFANLEATREGFATTPGSTVASVTGCHARAHGRTREQGRRARRCPRGHRHGLPRLGDLSRSLVSRPPRGSERCRSENVTKQGRAENAQASRAG
jgi:ketosteroid isomerase-like protein